MGMKHTRVIAVTSGGGVGKTNSELLWLWRLTGTGDFNGCGYGLANIDIIIGVVPQYTSPRYKGEKTVGIMYWSPGYNTHGFGIRALASCRGNLKRVINDLGRFDGEYDLRY